MNWDDLRGIKRGHECSFQISCVMLTCVSIFESVFVQKNRVVQFNPIDFLPFNGVVAKLN